MTKKKDDIQPGTMEYHQKQLKEIIAAVEQHNDLLSFISPKDILNLAEVYITLVTHKLPQMAESISKLMVLLSVFNGVSAIDNGDSIKKAALRVSKVLEASKQVTLFSDLATPVRDLAKKLSSDPKLRDLAKYKNFRTKLEKILDKESVEIISESFNPTKVKEPKIPWIKTTPSDLIN